MNNDPTLYTDELPEYPTNKKQINVSITKEVDLKPILYDAMKKSLILLINFYKILHLRRVKKKKPEVLKQYFYRLSG